MKKWIALSAAAGFVAGWTLRRRGGKPPEKAEAPEMAEEERKRLRAEQEAFRQLQHYSAETAYGLDRERREDEAF